MPRYTVDPHAPEARGEHWHPVKQKWLWWCDCLAHCDGTMRNIGRTTWFVHNPADTSMLRRRHGKTVSGGGTTSRRRHSQAGVAGQPSRQPTTNHGHSRGAQASDEEIWRDPAAAGQHEEELGSPAEDPENPDMDSDGEGRAGAGDNGAVGAAPEPELASGAVTPAAEDNAAGGAALDGSSGPAITPVPNASGQTETPQVAAAAPTPAEPECNIQMLRDSLCFIQDLRNARVSDDMFPKDLQKAVLEPAEKIFDFEDPDVELSLTAFLSISNASEDVYRQIQKMVKVRYPDSKMLSFEQIKKKTQEFSRVTPIINDMCVNTCIAFTSLYKELEVCPECGQDRYKMKKKKRVPRRRFYTLPIGPVIQGMWRNPVVAKYMAHRKKKTLENLNKYVSLVDGNVKICVTETDDITSGEDYLRCVTSGVIGLDDSVLLISMDGAQLYRQKLSDCWVYIWVLLDLPPHLRYKKDYVIPGGVIPGPKAPKSKESFLFPGLAHVASLQEKGLKIWDASEDRTFISKPIVALTGADGPAMVDFSGLVGHKGKESCREFCNMPGRRSDNQSRTYYPVLLKPGDGYDVNGSSHPDIDVLNLLHNHEIPGYTQSQYNRRLAIVLASKTSAQYTDARRDTGIAKPSIFSGLHIYPPMPAMFPSDAMHLFGLNIPSNKLDVLRGVIACDPLDDRSSWDFAVLTGDVWERHGKIIELWRPFFAAGFDHVPPNPVTHINSGYRSQEFLIYVYDLLPALLYKVLPETYWTTFCKLCAAVKILLQRKLTRAQIIESQRLIVEFVLEFELKFVQRKAYRAHFIRPCMHNIIHIPGSTLRVGPHCLYSQYTMENTIGNIVRELKQHTTPSANASQRAIRRAQVNTVKALIKNEKDEEHQHSTRFPRMPAGPNHTILWPKERTANGKQLPQDEFNVLEAFFSRKSIPFDQTSFKVKKWGRMELPTADIARSAWQEAKRECDDGPMRITRFVKFQHEDQTRFGEVLYFFAVRLDSAAATHHLAMVSMTSLLDKQILEKSSGSLRVCDFVSGTNLLAVEATTIEAVVSALPFPLMEGPDLFEEGRWFIIEDFGKQLSVLTGSTTNLHAGMAQEQEDDDDVDE